MAPVCEFVGQLNALSEFAKSQLLLRTEAAYLNLREEGKEK